MCDELNRLSEIILDTVTNTTDEQLVGRTLDQIAYVLEGFDGDGAEHTTLLEGLLLQLTNPDNPED